MVRLTCGQEWYIFTDLMRHMNIRRRGRIRLVDVSLENTDEHYSWYLVRAHEVNVEDKIYEIHAGVYKTDRRRRVFTAFDCSQHNEGGYGCICSGQKLPKAKERGWAEWKEMR